MIIRLGAASAQTLSTQGIDVGAIEAWRDAGASIGWIAPNADGAWLFSEKQAGNPAAVVAFRFTNLAPGALFDLPAPSAPFGLVLDGTAATDTDLKGLARLKNMRVLNVNRTQVTDVGVAELVGVELSTLYLGFTKVTDAGLSALPALETLQRLRLSGTAVTDVGLKELARLKRLDWLNLEDTRVTDVGLRELATLRELRSLHLGGTKVTDAGLKHLVVLENLQTLRLLNTEITDRGLMELAAFESLKTVGLRGTRVTASGVAALAQLRPTLTIIQ